MCEHLSVGIASVFVGFSYRPMREIFWLNIMGNFDNELNKVIGYNTSNVSELLKQQMFLRMIRTCGTAREVSSKDLFSIEDSQ